MTESGTAHVRGVELAWDRAGSGRTVVWGHGLNSSREAEDRWGVIDHFRLRSECDVVRYDARGHGLSTTTTDANTYGWDQMAADQVALADELGIESWIAAGASLGTATALFAALHEPERVEALVLVIPPTGWETRAEQVGIYEKMAAMADLQGVEPLIRGLDLGPVPDPLANDRDWFAARVENLRRADPGRLAVRLRGAATANLPARERLAGIAAPALILAWTGDSGHPVSSAEEIHGLLPNSELIISETPDEFATWTDLIVDFVGT